MTKCDRIDKCADRFVNRACVSRGEAVHLANICACDQAYINGESILLWEDPTDCADEEMVCWE